MNGADLVVAVRLKADGSGFVGQVRLGAEEVKGLGLASAEAGAQARTLAAGTNEAAGAARNAASASSQATAATEALASAQRQATASATALGNATQGVIQDERQFEASVARLRAQLDPLGESQRQAARDLELAETAFQRGAVGADVLAAAQKRMEQASRGVAVSFGQQRMAGMMVGQQLQDIGIQASMGTDPLRIMSMQGGQLAMAFDMMGMKGAGGRFASFMAGPYGAVILTAIAIGGPFLAQLFDINDALSDSRDRLEDAAKGADSFGTAQTLLGKIIDLTTGKLKTQNMVLVEAIRLTAQLNLLDAQRRIDKAAGNDKVTLKTPTPGSAGMMGLPGGDIDAAVKASADVRAQQQQLDGLRTVLLGQINNDALAQKNPSQYASVVGGQLQLTFQQLDKIAVNGRVAGKSLIDVKTDLISLATAATDKSAALQSIAAIATGKVGDDLTPYSKDKKKKTPKAKSTEARDEFGRDAADRISSITEAFDDTPAAVRQADRAIRQLDDLIDDLGRKKPPNFEALIKSAQEAKGTVQQGLIRTIADAFEKPETLGIKAAKAIDQLDAVIANLNEAKPAGFEALIADAERAKGVVEDGLLRPYNDFIQAQGEALQVQKLLTKGRDDEADALRIILQLEKQGVPITQARRDAVLSAVQALRLEQKETDTLHRKQQGYLNAITDTRSLITSTIEEGFSGLEKLPSRLLDIFKRFEAEWLTEKLFGKSIQGLQDQVTGADIVERSSKRMAGAVDDVAADLDTLGDAVTAAADRLNRAATTRAANPSAQGLEGIGSQIGEAVRQVLGEESDAIVVTGKKPKEDVLTSLGNPREFFEKMADKLIKGIGIDEKTAKMLGGFIGKGLEGAMTGQIVASIGNALGIKMNNTGAQIGGGIGKIASSVTGIPGLDIAGSIVGGLIGNLFTKPKYGTAILNSTSSDPTLNGSSADLRSGAGSLAEQVQSGLKQIADQLGGALGSFDLAIGTFDGKYRVRTTTSGWDGRGPLDYKGNSGNNLHDFGDDEASAIAFAISDAIADGAVKGLSAAVQAALRSSTDVEEALQEALKVADLEKLIGGIGAELKSTFDAFDATAAERVELAKKYGLDLLAVEKINAEQRADLLDQTLKSRVGELQDFLTNIKYGDLFEGTAAQRREAILAELKDAQADAEAGVEGAAARMAALRSQLLSTDREAFGTAGPEYATDRSDSISAVEKVIQLETDRVNQAAGLQQATNDAIAAGNELTDETNDLLAITNARLAEIAAAMQSSGGNGATASTAPNLALTARLARLGLSDEVLA